MRLFRQSRVVLSLGALGVLLTGTAAAQSSGAPGTVPPQTGTTESAPAGAAPPPATPAPAPAAAPSPAPSPAPTAPTVPPGYMLVPIPQQGQGAQTRYDVVYPQPRGALPPGMELPYEDGDPIPKGYRLVKRPRRGLIVAGSIVAGVPWSLSIVAAVGQDYEDKSGFLLVPVLGPWLMLAAGGAADDCDQAGDFAFCEDNAGERALLVFDGLVQTAGGIMFVSGFAFPRSRLVRKDVTVGVTPARVGRDGYGLSLAGTF